MVFEKMAYFSHTKRSQIKTIVIGHFWRGEKHKPKFAKIKMFDKTFAWVKVIGA